MRRLAAWCVTAFILMMMWSGTALAAPEQISLAVHESRLREMAQHLEAARKAASADAVAAMSRTADARRIAATGWLVDVPGGTVHVDLRPVLSGVPEGTAPTEGQVAMALASLQEHLKAAESARQAQFGAVDPKARQRLEEALREADARTRWYDRIGQWLARLFSRAGNAAGKVSPSEEVTAALTLGAAVVGAGGVIVLAVSLLRMLSGNAAGSDIRRKDPRSAQPDEPATPESLWETGRRLAVEGDPKEGLRLIHLALLQHLDRAGLIRYVPAQTNREHEWMLRRKQPALARVMHELNDLVDVRLFSGQGATVDDFRRGESLAGQIWREGDAASKSAGTTGASSSASSS